METYISMLRGINVGGHFKLPMPELKKLYEELKLKNPVTYIQSGNVIFQSQETDLPGIADRIRQKIKKNYGYEVPVIIRTISEMEAVIKKNPFIKMKGIDKERLHVTFLEEIPAEEKLNKIKEPDFSPDRFINDSKEVFLHCPDGYGRSKLNNSFFESKLKVTATTRNWKTVNELYRIAAGSAE